MTMGAQSLLRADGRMPGDLRPISIQLGVQKWAEGSCLIKLGGTEVVCAATIEDKTPFVSLSGIPVEMPPLLYSFVAAVPSVPKVKP